jgi:hypothetical protein
MVQFLISICPARLELTMTDNYFNARQIVDREISSLKPFARNARTHSAKQIHQIATSIREFGFTNPVCTEYSIQHGRREQTG